MDVMKLYTILTSILSLISVQCFNVDDVFITRVSTKKCLDFRKNLPEIFDVFNDNDEDAALKKFPFMAKIKNFATNYLNGILISENFVLTIASANFSGTKVVVLGNVGSKDDAYSKYFEVIEEIVHPQYNSDLTFDLSLLKLNDSVPFNDYIRPACLPQPNGEISQQLMEVGWSDTNIRTNRLLHKVKLNYTSNAECKDKFKFIAHQQKMMEKIDKETVFCAMAEEGARDMCIGFFGTALLNHNRNTMHEVIGIAATNTGCNDAYPTVFVRISASLTWIESIVWPQATTTEANKVDVTTTQASTTQSSTTQASTTQSSTTRASTTIPPSIKKVIDMCYSYDHIAVTGVVSRCNSFQRKNVEQPSRNYLKCTVQINIRNDTSN